MVDVKRVMLERKREQVERETVKAKIKSKNIRKKKYFKNEIYKMYILYTNITSDGRGQSSVSIWTKYHVHKTTAQLPERLTEGRPKKPSLKRTLKSHPAA